MQAKLKIVEDGKQFFEERGIPSPRTWLPDEVPADVRFPVLVKVREGFGSRHIYRADGPEQLAFHLRSTPVESMVQECCLGEEFSIDVFSDVDGRYQIAELRPGAYSVTFTLPGFATFRRDGLELSSNFVVTVNEDLRVGTLEETVVVSGQTPLVDVRSVSKGTVVTQETLAVLPTSKSVGGLLALVPGAV